MLISFASLLELVEPLKKLFFKSLSFEKYWPYSKINISLQFSKNIWIAIWVNDGLTNTGVNIFMAVLIPLIILIVLSSDNGIICIVIPIIFY